MRQVVEFFKLKLLQHFFLVVNATLYFVYSLILVTDNNNVNADLNSRNMNAVGLNLSQLSPLGLLCPRASW